MRILLSLLCLLALVQSVAAEPTKVILVLDASGSMAGTIHGRSKMEIARESVAQVVRGLSDGVQLGLMAYGHRRKGDCADIELLIPPGPLDREKFLAKVNSIAPLGNTPLTRAVEMAAETLKSESQPATVILVSDGLETCGGDPCTIALKLEATGMQFTTHVVAFDLSQQEALKIKCLADKTGGMFLRASDAGSLQNALKSVVQSSTPKKQSGASFLAKNARTGEALMGATWKVFKGTAPAGALDAAQGTMDLAVGNYSAKATYKSDVVEVAFEVQEGRTQPVEAVFGPATLRLLAVETLDSAPLRSEETGMFWTVTEIKADGSEGESYDRTLAEEPAVEVGPGTYRVKFARGMNVNFGTIEAEEMVKVEAGEVRTVKVIAAAGTMSITTKWAGAEIVDGAWVAVFPLNEAGVANEDKRLVYVQAQPVPALLAPGRYEARSEMQGAKVSGEFSVVSGVKSSMDLAFIAGRLEVQAMAGGKPSQELRWWNVFALNANGERESTPMYTAQDTQLTCFLPVGEFEVTYELGGVESAPSRFKTEKDKTTKGMMKSGK